MVSRTGLSAGQGEGHCSPLKLWAVDGVVIDYGLAQKINKGLRAIEKGSSASGGLRLFAPIRIFWKENPRTSTAFLMLIGYPMFHLFWSDAFNPLYTDYIKPYLSFCFYFWNDVIGTPIPSSFRGYNAKSPYGNLDRQQHFIDQSDLREKEILERQKVLEKKVEDLNQTLERGHSCKHVTSQP